MWTPVKRRPALIEAVEGGSNDSKSASERDQLLLHAEARRARGYGDRFPTSGGLTWRGSTNSRVSVHSSPEDSVNTLGGDLSLGSAALGAMSQLHRCVYTLNQLSTGLTGDVKAAESGHWRCPLS